MVKVKKDEKVEINRCLYKDIKKFDRKQMESFLQDIYEQGVKSGVEKVVTTTGIGKSVDYNAIQTALIGIKGLGEKRIQQVLQVIHSLLEREK